MLRKKESDRPSGPLIEPLAEGPGSIEPERSVVGQGITFDGKVTGKGNLVIQGAVKGVIRLEGNQVTIEEGGKVEADIQAESIVIRGVFKGNLAARGLVRLEKTAHFEGELKAARLQMEDGAKLNGGVELQRG